jgi:hypothetical protein
MSEAERTEAESVELALSRRARSSADAKAAGATVGADFLTQVAEWAGDHQELEPEELDKIRTTVESGEVKLGVFRQVLAQSRARRLANLASVTDKALDKLTGLLDDENLSPRVLVDIVNTLRAFSESDQKFVSDTLTAGSLGPTGRDFVDRLTNPEQVERQKELRKFSPQAREAARQTLEKFLRSSAKEEDPAPPT